MQAVVFTGAGGNEVVQLVERPDPVPTGNDVRVLVRYAGLNPSDAQQRAGRYPAPAGSPADIPGLEVSGIVDAAGDAVTMWSPGDRVFGIVGGGGLADRVVVNERHLARVPESLSDAEAAAVPQVYMTAHDAIRSQAELQAGETLLVHGAAGGVGSAAVQIGLAVGARVVGVARSESSCRAVKAFGAEVVHDADFAAGVAGLTGGRGADVILELVGAPHFPANLDAVAVRGRIIVVGVGGGSGAQIPLLRLMQKRIRVQGTVLRARTIEQKAEVVRGFEREVLPILASGRVRPVIDQIFPARRVASAFDRLEGPGKFGKVLLDFVS
ncbi:zinc-binding dehydrogenase [Dactylosporangium darangshiense]|uniref:NAD(P)H-quinone oxidoreductase n=1 Tax=Dactylosporangium darangshiense TaxID=579108 RepID=A0ABP8DUN2_9ACTN